MKILIVEDNDRLRNTLLEHLREEGFAADAAADGEEGLYKAMNWEYDAVILDVMMPKLDGFDVLQKLRTAGRTFPVIMLTARDQIWDRLHGLNGGADDYLTKPFELDELVARVRTAIRRSANAPNPYVEIGEIKLNTATRTAYVGSQMVILTAREYAMMEILALHKDEVVTREYLYERLFDERDESVSNMLDVYIYKLRQKFGKDHIQTRRGMGYQLVP